MTISQSDRWLLPAGIEEILPPEAMQLEACRRALIDLFDGWGYDLVIPPLIEYLESLLTATAPDLDLQTFKLIDQLSGRLMGVRADMTPQVARIDAHHLARMQPSRLCYIGTVLHTRPDGFSGSRSPIQVGAELYGHAGIESDCEVLGLMLETLAVAGIRDVHVDVGHAGIFRALARQGRLSAEQEGLLFDALQLKARAEIEALVGDFRLPSSLAEMIAQLVQLNGGEEVLDAARDVLTRAAPPARAALESLATLAASMRRRVPGLALHFDLAELRGYRYERGIVFAAFVPGHGQEIARGGRYDGIGGVFGRARAATGFSTDLKTLVALGGPPRAACAKAILAPWSDEPDLQRLVQELRRSGERVVQALPGQTGGAAEMGCDRELVRVQGAWRVAATRAPAS